MHRALAIKELRETGWMALVALLLLVGYTSSAMGIWLLPWVYSGSGWVPFVNDGLFGNYTFVAGLFAAALGFRQTVWESMMDTDKLLLHRPISRTRLVGTKLLTGCTLLLVCISLPVLAYGLWAAAPGNHPSPFEWSMTFPFWQAIVAMTMVYLGSFLCGLRPGRWYGTRLLPLAAVGGAVSVFLTTPWLSNLEFLLVAVVDGLLVAAILLVAQSRDY